MATTRRDWIRGPRWPREAILHPTQEEIATCAYLIWKAEGEPEGREQYHWRQAELILREEQKQRRRRQTRATFPPMPAFGGE